MTKEFIWQHESWPKFDWDTAFVLEDLHACRQSQLRLFDLARSLDFESARDFHAEILAQEIIQNSAIEGERLDHASVRSSVARHLGLGAPAKAGNRKAFKAAAILFDAMKHYDSALSAERLKAWHRTLFPQEAVTSAGFTAGDWRKDLDGRMQVISKHHGVDRIHFTAPPAGRVELEMTRFLTWFNSSRDKLDGMLRAATAHLWFLTIHPFDDGNGRIARTVSDLALAQAEGTPQRFYSISQQILKEKSDYYEILEKTQRGSIDLSEWIKWSMQLMKRAIDDSCNTIERITFKAVFWDTYRQFNVNDRQQTILNKLLDAGDDFSGHMNTQKAARITGISTVTASRDLSELEQAGILVKNPGRGRSTSYQIALGLEDKLSRLALQYIHDMERLAKAKMELKAHAQKVSHETFKSMRHRINNAEKSLALLREDLQTTAQVLQKVHGEQSLRHHLTLTFGQEKARFLLDELNRQHVRPELER